MSFRCVGLQQLGFVAHILPPPRAGFSGQGGGVQGFWDPGAGGSRQRNLVVVQSWGSAPPQPQTGARPTDAQPTDARPTDALPQPTYLHLVVEAQPQLGHVAEVALHDEAPHDVVPQHGACGLRVGARRGGGERGGLCGLWSCGAVTAVAAARADGLAALIDYARHHWPPAHGGCGWPPQQCRPRHQSREEARVVRRDGWHGFTRSACPTSRPVGDGRRRTTTSCWLVVVLLVHTRRGCCSMRHAACGANMHALDEGCLFRCGSRPLTAATRGMRCTHAVQWFGIGRSPFALMSTLTVSTMSTYTCSPGLGFWGLHRRSSS